MQKNIWTKRKVKKVKNAVKQVILVILNIVVMSCLLWNRIFIPEGAWHNVIIIALLGVWIFLNSFVFVIMQNWSRFHEVEEMKMELDELNAEFDRLEKKQEEAKDILRQKYGVDCSEDEDEMLKKLSAFPAEQVRKDFKDHRDIMEEISKEYDQLICRGERIRQKAARMGVRC